MKFKNGKAAVFVVLALLLVAQIVYAGVHSDSGKNTESGTVLVQEENTEDLSEISQTAAVASLVEDEADAEVNVVYRSTVTAGEVNDVFETESSDCDFTNKIVSYTLDELPIYAEASVDSEVLGVLYSGGEGDIVEKGDTFTEITSNGITGYVRNVDVLFGDEAQVIAEYCGSRMAEVVSDDTAVYTEASEGTVLTTLSAGTTLDAYENYGNYIMVGTDAGTGYVSKDAVNITYGLSEAKSMEEIRAEEAAAEEARRKAAAEEAARREQEAKGRSESEETTYRGAYNASDYEVHLLTAIIYWEAGWEPAEGQLAVANVVLNRIYSSEFSPTTIEGVIYSPGQFYGVADNWSPTSRFQAVLDMSNDQLNVRGCYDAAIRALNGENNIGDYCFFISVGKANYSRYISYCIINNHCFYKY